MHSPYVVTEVFVESLGFTTRNTKSLQFIYCFPQHNTETVRRQLRNLIFFISGQNTVPDSVEVQKLPRVSVSSSMEVLTC